MMPRAVTMKDLARAAGVSVMTVSRALRADGAVLPDTAARIRKLADEMGYVFDSQAANLRRQRSGFVAALIPSLNNANFADTVGALTGPLGAAEMQVLLGATGYDVLEEERLIQQLLSRRPEAIVLTGGRHTDRARHLLERSAIPIVETWDVPDYPIGHVVGFSNAATMEAMVKHLYDLGHRSIAFMGGDSEEDARGAERRRGFVAAMEQRGLTSDLLFSLGRPPILMRSGVEAMEQVMADPRKPSAVICVADLPAFGAISHCQRAGVRVPDDIAIAGFGGYDIASISVPSMTTIDPFPKLIGAKTAELILACCNGEITEPQRFEISPRLIVGESTGQPI